MATWRETSIGHMRQKCRGWDGTNGQVGPFEAALGTFYTGNILPIVVGAFGEVNEDASKLITHLARLAARLTLASQCCH